MADRSAVVKVREVEVMNTVRSDEGNPLLAHRAASNNSEAITTSSEPGMGFKLNTGFLPAS